MLHTHGPALEAGPSRTPSIISAATAPSAVSEDLHALARDYGVTEQGLRDLVANFGGRFALSASRGQRLKSLNDHAGVLVVPALVAGLRVAERFAVVEVEVPSADGQAPERRFLVRGYGNRVVRFDDFRQALQTHSDIRGGAAVQHVVDASRLDWLDEHYGMETPLRSELKNLSAQSELYLRRRAKESDTPHTTAPPNPSS